MNATAVSDKIGVASAVKMCRSVMIKGMEALAVECLFAARRYGAEEAVLASLDATYPQMGWRDKLPDYLVSRVAEHGRRRAAEMREVAESLRDVGIDPLMAEATGRAARSAGRCNDGRESQVRKHHPVFLDRSRGNAEHSLGQEKISRVADSVVVSARHVVRTGVARSFAVLRLLRARDESQKIRLRLIASPRSTSKRDSSTACPGASRKTKDGTLRSE